MSKRRAARAWRRSLFAGVIVGLLTATIGLAASLGVTPKPLTVFRGSATIPCVQDVAMSSGNVFTPATTTTAPGCSVRWTNTVSTKHTTTSDTSLWDSGDMNQGQTYTRVFPSAGTFPYRCSRHPGTMQGTIVVA
jgi:plastocyanin